MSELYIFTDASCSNGIGVGSYIITDNLNADKYEIKNIFLMDTSSTNAEIRTLLHILENLEKNDKRITIFTDSQCLEKLLERRNKNLNNLLYDKFFSFYDIFKFNIEKLEGHKKKINKNNKDLIFTLVDKDSRKKLRSYIKNSV